MFGNYLNENYRGFEGWIEGAEGKCKAGYGSPNSLEEAATMLADCKAWREMTDKVNTTLEAGKASADKMTLHEEQDKLYTEMRARWVEVDKSCKEWSVKLDELAGMWTKQTGESQLSEVMGWFVVYYFGHKGKGLGCHLFVGLSVIVSLHQTKYLQRKRPCSRVLLHPFAKVFYALCYGAFN